MDSGSQVPLFSLQNVVMVCFDNDEKSARNSMEVKHLSNVCALCYVKRSLLTSTSAEQISIGAEPEIACIL